MQGLSSVNKLILFVTLLIPANIGRNSVEDHMKKHFCLLKSMLLSTTLLIVTCATGRAQDDATTDKYFEISKNL